MPTLDQSAYRWRNDDGSETTATWAAALNTSLTGLLDHKYRLRLATSLGATGSVNWSPKLQYNKNAAGWNDVNASSSVARSVDSTNFTDNDPTTQQLVGGGSPFNAGRLDDVSGACTNVSLDDAGAIETEHEFCFQVRSADVTGGDQIQFRIAMVAGGTYNTYSQIGLFIVPDTYAKGQFFPFFE